jgi:glycogen debranching enzyme
VADDLVVLDGSTFLVSSPNGDIEPELELGFFYADVRHLSRWQLRVDGQPLRLLSAGNLAYYSARMVGTLGRDRVGDNPTLSVRRDRFVQGGIHEDVVVENHSESEQELVLEMLFECDFADIFEVKEGSSPQGVVSVQTDEWEVRYDYSRDGYHRGTVVAVTAPARLEAGRARFELRLAPRERWQVCLEVSPVVDGRELRVEHQDLSILTVKPQMPLTLEEWLEQAPELITTWDTLRATYHRSLVELAALRFRPLPDVDWSLPAAGLPWFMALFGRDSLLTSYQTLPFRPQLAYTALHTLARLQAKELDHFRDAEPGKILHELRRGVLAALGEAPQTPYYGSHDATPLFLVLLEEYERWTGDADTVLELEQAARAALDWMAHWGDPDGDGFLEYQTRSPRGLENQGWKDSWNAMLFADGRQATGPIAVCEVQGYAYDALVRCARLAREIWKDVALSDRLLERAARLKDSFHEAFWNEERGIYVLALDGRKQQVDSATSNMGHLLWSGIAQPECAGAVAERLMSPQMFTGWGIRTMSSEDAGFNPIEYHNGTVWPHDTALVAEGLRRYGMREEAGRLAAGLIEGAAHFDHLLPEVFAGFSRQELSLPVEYPTASRPQAWAAGAPLLLLRTLLGLDVIDGQLVVDPHLTGPLRGLALEGLNFRETRVRVG